MERPPGPIYKGRKINVRHKNRGAEFLDMRRSCRLDCRRLINEGGLYTDLNNKVTSRRFTRILEDDVTAVYKIM